MASCNKVARSTKRDKIKDMIRTVNSNDAEALCIIYNDYVENTTISFEVQPVTVADMKKRIETATLPWLVYEMDKTAVGYAYASKWKARSAYRFTAETTVYLSKTAVNQRIGTQLYEALLLALRDTPIHALIGVIALPNTASIALHEKLGYEKVAHFKEVGWKFNRRIDVGYWELII